MTLLHPTPVLTPLTIENGEAHWQTAGALETACALRLDRDATLVIRAAAAGASGYLEVEQDETGGRRLALPPGTRFGAAEIRPDPCRKTALAWGYDGAAFRFVIAWEV
jgi:hypothetical protein